MVDVILAIAKYTNYWCKKY